MKNLIILALLVLPFVSFSQHNYYENICDTQEKKDNDILHVNEFDWEQPNFAIRWCSTPNSPAHNTVGKLLAYSQFFDSTLEAKDVEANTKIEYREADNGYLLQGKTNNGIVVLAWGNSPQECLYNMDILLSTGKHSRGLMQENRIPR